MATIEEVARDLIGSIASDAGAVIAAKWLDNRYQQLVARAKFRNLRAVGELYLPALITDGTVDATRDSTSITGDSTTWLTAPSNTNKAYYAMRISSAWYAITSVDSDTGITLSTAFSEDDVSDGTYVIAKRYHALNSSARWVTSFIHTRLRQQLDLISQDEMNILYPGRTLTGVYPCAVAQVGYDANSAMQVEVYPPPVNSEILHYVYTALPSSLSIASTIPPVIDPYVLKEGAKIDLYEYMMGKAAANGQAEMAAFWRNEKRAQNVTWENCIKEAIHTQRGVDDLAFVLQRFGAGRAMYKGQRTAHDIVYDRWI